MENGRFPPLPRRFVNVFTAELGLSKSGHTLRNCLAFPALKEACDKVILPARRGGGRRR